MPELPEVETIVRELNRKISGKKLSRFFAYDKKIKKPLIPLPTRILGIWRRGKYIIFDLDCGKHCLVHLRMTGKLLLKKRQSAGEPDKHERARFCLSDGSALYFFDARRFGTIHWRNKKFLPQLGLEPLSKEFNANALRAMLCGSVRPIKSFLLDQTKIAGIGNIYADEALWLAKIHPARKSNLISAEETERLALAIKSVLREAIQKKGISIRNYRRTDDSLGYYQTSRKVYDREGRLCRRRCSRIRRIKVGGRSSYFCLKCQK